MQTTAGVTGIRKESSSGNKSNCETEIKVSSDFLSKLTRGFGQNEQRKAVRVVRG